MSKTSWLIITIGIFIIISVGLGFVRSQQIQQQNQLNEKLVLSQAKVDGIQLEQLSYRQKELEQQLNQTKSEAETAKTILSQPIESTTIGDTLFAAAKANSVEIIEIISPGLNNEELETVPCSALPLAVRAEGKVANLVSFIVKLNDDLATGVVKSVEINIPETLGENKTVAYIQMVIYSYQGG